MMNQNHQVLKESLVDQRKQITELLNRVQSKDLHAFATMQMNTKQDVKEDPPVIRSDEAEAKRMLEMYGGVEGIGDVIYNQEELDLAADLGLRLE